LPPLEAYLWHQASLCAPDDPKDTLGYAKAVQDSVEAEQQHRLSSDDEYAKWWSAYDSGTIIDVADSDGPEVDDDAASDNAWLHSSYCWSMGDDDDGGDSGDEADSGPRCF
jgi:hypothetical protein